MDNQLIRPIKVSEISQALGITYFGEDVFVTRVEAFSNIGVGALCFSKNSPNKPLPRGAVVITPEELDAGCTLFIAKNPRLTYARILNWLNFHVGFERFTSEPKIDSTAAVSPRAHLGSGVVIGPRTRIGPFVVIHDGVVIGSDCEIKANSVIGDEGFGFERDEIGIPIRIIHLGGVRIGNFVEIGNCNTVCRGVLADTVIEDYVKTDGHVHIGHNCHIGSRSMIIACAELSGGVILEPDTWIGPNSSIIQKVVIGRNAFVGIGATVTKSVEAGMSVAGNPARAMVKVGI